MNPLYNEWFKFFGFQRDVRLHTSQRDRITVKLYVQFILKTLTYTNLESR